MNREVPCIAYLTELAKSDPKRSDKSSLVFSMNNPESRYQREPTSVPGDFYVENHCCTSCGVPQVVAPDLVGWIDEGMGHCYWKKQPETHQEMRQAFAIFDGQELGCHRYAGNDPDIQARIGPANCDNAPSNFRAWTSSKARDLQLLIPAEAGWFGRLWAALWGRK